MPSLRKVFIHNTPIFITSRVEEGLPFVPNELINGILRGILAQARAMYDIAICHHVFMANHFHMISVVRNPEHVSDFVEYVKRESAHAINRLLGRRKGTVWCDGFDSPVILTSEDVIRKIVYIYANPVSASLVPSIAQYPGLSSWNMYMRGETRKCWKKFSRRNFRQLKETALTRNKAKRLWKNLQKKSHYEPEFVLEPAAWMKCFPETMNLDPVEIRKRICTEVTAIERELANETSIGAEALQQADIAKHYQPKKFSRRMICISSDKEKRISFIQWFKSLSARGHEIFQQWKQGGIAMPLPPGLFAPGGVLFASLLPFELPHLFST